MEWLFRSVYGLLDSGARVAEHFRNVGSVVEFRRRNGDRISSVLEMVEKDLSVYRFEMARLPLPGMRARAAAGGEDDLLWTELREHLRFIAALYRGEP
mgnify:CR=1 FL=1